MGTAVLENHAPFATGQGLAHYLYDEEISPALSPRRFSHLLGVDLQTLANQAHVHRNTIARSPKSESVQIFLRETLRVLQAASDVAEGDISRAVYWYKNLPLAVFSYKTPQTLVAEGQTENLIRYIRSQETGFAE